MSLSAYLTRDEWNAAFFVGAHAASEDRIPRPRDLSDHLRWGLVLLHRAGMTFRGVIVRADDPSGVEKVSLIDDPSNVSVLADFISGRFDGRTRLDEFLVWAKQHPEIDVRATTESIRAQLDAMPKR